MAAITYNLGTLRSFQRVNYVRKVIRAQKRLYCSSEKETEKKVPLSGFAASFIEHSKLNESDPPKSFATLIRHSKFVDLGDPEGKLVVGTIYHVMGDDLYIDFGWKFPTVCTKPKKNEHLYIQGAKVKLLIKDLELSTRFLGGTKDLTLCEADCLLLGLAK